MSLTSTPLFKSFLENWRKVQDFFSFAIGLPISLYDSQGNVLISSGSENPLCQTLKSYPRVKGKCFLCPKENIGLTLEKGEPVVFQCFANLHYFLIPIEFTQNEKLLLLGGKVYFSREDFLEFIKKTQDLKLTVTDLNILLKTVPIKSPASFEILFLSFKTILPSLLKDSYLKIALSKQLFRLETFTNFIIDFAYRLSPEEIYPLFLQTLSSLFNVSTSAVIAVDKRRNALETITVFGLWEDILRRANLRKSKLIEKVLTEEKPLFSNKVQEVYDTAWSLEISSVHLFPFHRTEEKNFLLCIFNSKLSPEEVELVFLFCKRLSLVLESVESRELFYKKLSYLSFLTEINRFLNTEGNLETLYQTILEKSAEFVEAERASLMIYNESTGELLIKVAKGINKEIIEHLKIKVGEGIAGGVYKEGKPLLVRDLVTELKKERGNGYKSNSFISVPLKSDKRVLGVLNFADKISRKYFNEEDLEFLLSLVPYFALAIERTRFYFDSEHYRQLSIVDYLTGLGSRRYFEQRLKQEIERAKRYSHCLSLLIADIDDFKIINDHKGHLTGDEVLKMIGQLFKSNLREVDIIARYGGEEFAVVLPETDKEKATQVAERIRRMIENFLPLQALGLPLIRITLSFGVASYPADAENCKELIAKADEALYLAKAQGKNKVVFYTE